MARVRSTGSLSHERSLSGTVSLDENIFMDSDFAPEVNSFRTRSYHSLPPNNKPSLITEVNLHPSVNVSKKFVSLNKSYAAEKHSFCFTWFTSRWRRWFRRAKIAPANFTSIGLQRGSETSSTFLRHRRGVESRSSFDISQTASPFGQESKRNWGEEREDDAVYTITLKRVNRNATPLSITQATNGLQWETQKVRLIKGATVSRLVTQLCKSFMEDCEERHFLTVFLATFRSFASAEEVLDLIVKEKDNLKDGTKEYKNQILRSTIRVLRTWLEKYFLEDFNEPPRYPLLNRLQELAEEYRKNDEVYVSDFLTYTKTKIKGAEKKKPKNIIEKIESNSPLVFADTTNNSIRHSGSDDEITNTLAVKTFLNDLTPRKVAEQLTLIDATYFLRVVPHHCLYAVRSSKGKPATVKATIDQFNRVVYCVLATCLYPNLKSSQRVKIFCKWIEIAQACRELKNFSSLRAVISGLQAHPVHRLRRTWHQLPQAQNHLLKELEQINTKDSILKVGTAKVNTERSSIHQVRKDASLRRQKDIHSGIMHGTVPYLGSFLSDLTYLHTAIPDFLEEGLINFDKRRKEFELLAQLQLWQVSCRSYHHFELDDRFCDWFNSVALPSDEQAIKLSEEIEQTPLSPATTPCKRAIGDVFASHQHVGLTSSGSSGTSLPVSQARSPTADLRAQGKAALTPKQNGHVTNSTDAEGERTVHVQIIKKNANLQRRESERAKELKLCSNDRSPAFVRKAFNLFELEEENANKFRIMQILPGDKDLTIPDNGNVFYAMNSSADEYKFALVEEGASIPREKTENRRYHSPAFLKSKKASRRNILSPSAASPMRTIYKHLGISGFSWANSGSYSMSKAAQRQRTMSGAKSEEVLNRTSENNSSSNRANGDVKSLKSGSLHSTESDNSFASSTEVYTPLKDRSMLTCVDGSSHDVDQRTSSTWPRSQTFTLNDATDHPKLHRQTAIRKHHSHPRTTSAHLSAFPRTYADSSSATFMDRLSIGTSSDDPGSPFELRKSESRSEDFVTFEEHQCLHRPLSADLLANLYDTIPESKGELRRSASDPCIVDTVEAENEVFDESSTVPYLCVEVATPRLRRSSQTRTTYL